MPELIKPYHAMIVGLNLNAKTILSRATAIAESALSEEVEVSTRSMEASNPSEN